MAEESVRDANAAIARALVSVAKAEAEVSEWNELMKSNISNTNALGAIITGLREANERLKEANERLKAREYHLRLIQPVQPAFQTENALIEKIENLQIMIQERLSGPHTPSSHSSTALGQLVRKRIARNFIKLSPTHGIPILREAEQMAIPADIFEKELVMEMTQHFNRMLRQTEYPLVFVNSEDFGWLEQHPDVSRDTDMKPDGFVTFQGLYCTRERQGGPVGFQFGTPFAKLLDSIVIFEAKRVINDSALGEVSIRIVHEDIGNAFY